MRPGTRAAARRLRWAAVLLAVTLVTLLPAAPAFAHATLLATTPADTALVDRAPAEVTLHYNEHVGTALGAIKVIAPDGSRVDTGQVGNRDGGRTVFVPLRAGLAQGTYTILARIVSADSHTVASASTFSIGQASAAGVSASDQAGAGDAAKNLLAAARATLYAGLALLLGGLAFLLVLWPAGRSIRVARRVPWTGWALAVLGSAASLLLQGPYAAGRSPAGAFDPALVAQVLDTRFGVAVLARLGLLALAAAALVAVARVRRRVSAAAAAGLGAGLLVTTSAAGHASTGDLDGLAFVADTLHLGAASAWIGGLAMLALVLLRPDLGVLAGVLPRWSRYAAAAVAVIVATGTLAAWRQVREFGALTDTAYGRMLLVKIGLVGVMLGLGALGRSWIQRHYVLPVVHAASATATEVTARPAPTGTAVTRLRRSVLLEAGTAIGVLILTAVLAATTPAYASYSPTFAQKAPPSGALRAQLGVEVRPARVGLNDMHLRYTAGNGEAVDVVQVTARWTRKGSDDTIPVVLTRTGVGRYDRTQIQLPTAGIWRLAVTTRTSEIDAATTVFTVRVR